jgi:multimeric flavodoxin WrbA
MKKILFHFAILLSILIVSCNNASNEKTETTTDEQVDNYGIKYSETSVNKKEHKSVLVISASPRRGGNTDLLCDEFMRGATEAGGVCEKIFLPDYNIGYFTEEDERRVGDHANDATDDVPMLVDKMVKADVIVLSSPVYFMNINGQLKTLIDRTFSRYREIKDKEFFYITACADMEESTADFAITGFRGFVMCLPNPTERGSVKAIGLGPKAAVKDTKYMQQAYELGKKI